MVYMVNLLMIWDKIIKLMKLKLRKNINNKFNKIFRLFPIIKV
jgi:hypothetical protein